MSSKFSKPIRLALAVLLTTAPLALAQQPGSSMGGQTGSSMKQGSGHPSTDTPTTGTHSSQSGGMMGMHEAINATVAEVNQQQKTVKLRTQAGEMVEFKVPERSLMDLKQGDSVQVSIRKTNGQAVPSDTPKAQPGSGTSSGTGTAPRSH